MSSAAPLDVNIPGDKSLSHRALIFGALANGRSHITGLLDSADIRSTRECLRRLGVDVGPMGPGMRVDGRGVTGLADASLDLDCGNSGTTARLLAGLVAGAARTARFVGDASLSKRPMKRVAEPLTQMGARVEFEGGDGLPMRITGTRLGPIDFTSVRSSAQIKSAVLLAGFTAGVAVTYREPSLSRDHTERMLSALGAPIQSAVGSVALGEHAPWLPPFEFEVPGDPSSAAFFAAWAVLTRRAIRTGTISTNPTRTGFLVALEQMGATVDIDSSDFRCGEPVGQVTVSGELTRGIVLGAASVPGLIDELPMLACLGAYAPSETRVTGAEELRVKESDRIAAVVSNLRAIGADADELRDGFVVRGGARALKGRVVTHGDHRIAMAFGVLGALPGNEIVLDDPACVDVSFPNFWGELRKLGAGGRA